MKSEKLKVKGKKLKDIFVFQLFTPHVLRLTFYVSPLTWGA